MVNLAEQNSYETKQMHELYGAEQAKISDETIGGAGGWMAGAAGEYEGLSQHM